MPEGEPLFSIYGSNTIGAKLGPALAESYLKSIGASDTAIIPAPGENETRISGYLPGRNGFATIYIAAHGSSSGFKALSEGTADIAAASRPIKQAESQLLSAMGDFSAPESEKVVGIDGLAIIIHPDNPIDRLDIRQVARLFSGDITNWEALGGANLPVTLFARDNRSGTWDTFKSLVLSKQFQLSASAMRFESNQALSREVSLTPGGIGFVSVNTIGASKPLRLSSGSEQALSPEYLNIATEDYALSRRLYMYMPQEEANSEARAFLDYVTSDQAQPVVSAVGYIPQSIKLLDTDNKFKPSSYIDIVGGHKRASLNFRFNQGKAKLDNKALADIERLARYLKHNPADVLLIGFAEQNDKAKHSHLLSQLRAEAVKHKLIKAGVSRRDIRVKGYGPFLSLSASNNLKSRIYNRRVEVWVKQKNKDDNHNHP